MNKRETASEVEALLRTKYSGEAWAFLPQVRNSTGYSRTIRTADALAMGLWPSRGLHLQGFEIKVNRGDWLSELNAPDKAEAIGQYCDMWWMVAPEGIINLEEVPTLWGLMVVRKGCLKVIKDAPLKECREVSKAFLAGILRKAQDIVVPKAKLAEAFQSGVTKGRCIGEQLCEKAKKDLTNLAQVITNFERESGVKIDKWRGDDIGRAVRLVLAGEHFNIKSRLEGLLAQSRHITEAIESQINLKDTKSE